LFDANLTRKTRYTPLEEIAAYFDDPAADKAKQRIHEVIKEGHIDATPSKLEA
jgi:hypothetical protein